MHPMFYKLTTKDLDGLSQEEAEALIEASLLKHTHISVASAIVPALLDTAEHGSVPFKKFLLQRIDAFTSAFRPLLFAYTATNAIPLDRQQLYYAHSILELYKRRHGKYKTLTAHWQQRTYQPVPVTLIKAVQDDLPLSNDQLSWW